MSHSPPSRRSLPPAAGLPLPVLLLVVATACSPATAEPSRAEGSGEPAAAVQVETIAPVTDHRVFSAHGSLVVRDEVKLSFKIGGVVSRIAVDDGERVERGGLLATLDTSEIDAAVRQAEAGLRKAERDRSRAEELEAAGASSRSLSEDATTGVEVAREQLSVARFNQRHAVLRAPFAGRVVKRLSEPGEMIGPGMPVLWIVADSAASGLRAELGLVAAEASRVATGDAVEVLVGAVGVSLTGTIEEVSPAPLPGSMTWQAWVRLEPAAASAPPLLPGMPLVARITPQRSEQVVKVPLTSLAAVDGESATLFVVESGVARRRSVTLASVDPDGARIVDGEALVGAAVVTRGGAWLRDGARVAVAPAPAQVK